LKTAPFPHTNGTDMFHGIVDYSAEENPAVYGTVISLAAVVLTYAYHNVMLVQRRRLIAASERARKQQAVTTAAIADAKANQQRLATNEARFFAFFAINAAYLALAFVASSHSVFGRFGPAANYVLSTVVPAAILAYGTAYHL